MSVGVQPSSASTVGAELSLPFKSNLIYPGKHVTKVARFERGQDSCLKWHPPLFGLVFVPTARHLLSSPFSPLGYPFFHPTRLTRSWTRPSTTPWRSGPRRRSASRAPEGESRPRRPHHTRGRQPDQGDGPAAITEYFTDAWQEGIAQMGRIERGDRGGGSGGNGTRGCLTENSRRALVCGERVMDCFRVLM